MKKIVFSLSFIAIALFAFVACEKDQVTPLDTQTTVVEYTVLVVDGSNAFKSTAGLDGVSVTISSEGQPRTAVTNTSGQATFSGLKPGVVAVTVEKTGFLTADFLADLKPVGTYDNISTRSAATKITLISTDATAVATVICTVNADTDLSDTVTVNLPGASVVLTAQMSSFGTLSQDIGSDGSVTGLNVNGTVVSGTTDATGKVTILLPATLAGIGYSITPVSYVSSQTNIDTVVVSSNTYNSATQTFTVKSGQTYTKYFNMAK